MHIKVLRIVDIPVRALPDALKDPRLEVEQDGAWDVARVVALVEEDVLPVAAGVRARRGVVGEVAVGVDAVFLAELLPELRADWGEGGV